MVYRYAILVTFSDLDFFVKRQDVSKINLFGEHSLVYPFQSLFLQSSPRECLVRRNAIEHFYVHATMCAHLTYAFDLPKNGIEGYADGMTIDTDRNLWVAVFLGSCVLKVGPSKGEILQKMPIQVEKITDSVGLGEGPHWDDRQQALFFISSEKSIHKYIPATGKHTKTKLENNVPMSFVIPVEGTLNQFVVGALQNILIVEWDGEEGSKLSVVKEFGEVEPEKPENHMNDGKVDPRGRLFTGTLDFKSQPPTGLVPDFKGSIIRVDPDKDYKIEKVWDGITVANGLTSNLTYVFDLLKNGFDGYPDGMTIDTDGNIWVAVFLSSCVLKIDPRTGELLQKVSMPVVQVTSCTFGGPNLDVLYVTTASIDFFGQKHPGGSTYMVTALGVKGLPNVSFKYKL